MPLFNPTKTGVSLTVRVLSETFDVPKRNIAIMAGGKSRSKRMHLRVCR